MADRVSGWMDGFVGDWPLTTNAHTRTHTLPPLPPLLLFPTGTEVFPLPTNEEVVTWARELLRIGRDNAP